MKAIDILMAEHRVIEQVLGGLEAYANDVERGKDLPLADLGKFVTFIREFADRCHHGKEEDILFESMAQNGFSKQSGPVAMMLFEHTEGRRFVKALVAASQEKAWTPALRAEVAQNARGYISLLTSHIQKEDNVLYPMAVSSLPHERMSAMGDEFVEFEANVMGKGVHEQYHALADELIERYAGKSHKAAGGCQHHHHHHDHAHAE